jgi:DNA-binding transcriptional regulator LsrR (DeoR family)
MTQKLSPQKVSKMMALYFEGYPQSQIAEKLKINQATASLYVGKFVA